MLRARRKTAAHSAAIHKGKAKKRSVNIRRSHPLPFGCCLLNRSLWSLWLARPPKAVLLDLQRMAVAGGRVHVVVAASCRCPVGRSSPVSVSGAVGLPGRPGRLRAPMTVCLSRSVWRRLSSAACVALCLRYLFCPAFLLFPPNGGMDAVAALSGYRRPCRVLHILFIDVNLSSNTVSVFILHFYKIEPCW